MFQFRRFPTYAYLIQRRLTEYCSAGFPHSEISGSTVICTSPKLIAACHVLHRLLMPRHSPCALLRLTLLSCEQESKQRKLSWTTTLRQCLLLPLLSYSPLYKERSRSGSQAFELCRLRVLRNCLCYPFRKVPQIIFVSLCCLLFILGYFVQFSRCVSSFFRNQIQTLNSLNACIQSRAISPGPVTDGTRGVPRTSVLAKPKPCRRGNSFAPRMSYPLWGSPFDGNQMGWWAQVDSNHRPHDYQSCALAS